MNSFSPTNGSGLNASAAFPKPDFTTISIAFSSALAVATKGGIRDGSVLREPFNAAGSLPRTLPTVFTESIKVTARFFVASNALPAESFNWERVPFAASTSALPTANNAPYRSLPFATIFSRPTWNATRSMITSSLNSLAASPIMALASEKISTVSRILAIAIFFVLTSTLITSALTVATSFFILAKMDSLVGSASRNACRNRAGIPTMYLRRTSTLPAASLRSFLNETILC